MVISWQVINVLQFLNFVPLMMIYTPSCLVQMLESYSIYNTELGAVGASLIRGLFTQNNYNNQVDYKFERAGYTSTAFLWNAADILTIWMFCVSLLPLLLFLKFIFSQVEIFHTLEDRFKKSFTYIIIMMSYTKMSFSVALNLAHANFNNFTSGFSLFLACCFACVIVAFPPYETYNAIVYYRELRKGNRPTYFRLDVLFYDFGVLTPYQYFYTWQLYIRRFFLAIMLVAWPQSRYLTL